MIAKLAVLLAGLVLVTAQPGMPTMPNMQGLQMPQMPQMGQMGQQAQQAQGGQQTSTNAMNVGPSVFSQDQIAAVQRDYARRIGMDQQTAQNLDAQLMAQIAAQRTAPAAGQAAQGFRAMQMNVQQPLNGFGAAQQIQQNNPNAQPLLQSLNNQQLQAPFGQNPLGGQQLGQNPLGNQPIGQPMGGQPFGGFPAAAAAGGNNQNIMGVDRNFMQQLMNQPQMQQYQRSLTDMGYGANAQQGVNQPMNQQMNQQMNQPMNQQVNQQMNQPMNQQMNQPMNYQTQSMDSPYSYSTMQMNMPGQYQPGQYQQIDQNVQSQLSNMQPTQQSVQDLNAGYSQLLAGIGQGMSQGRPPISIAGRNIAAGPPQTMESSAIPTQGNLFATIPGVGRIDLGIPRVIPAGSTNGRVQASQMNAATSPNSGRVSTPMPTQIAQGQQA